MEWFGPDSTFISLLLVASVVLAVLLYLVRKVTSHQGMKDFFGISSAFFVLIFVAVVMIVVEHAGG